MVEKLATLPKSAWLLSSTYRRGRTGSIADCQIFEHLSPTHLVGNLC